MYAIIRQITIQPHLVEEAIKITGQVFLPVLRNEPGFVDFYSILVAENEAMSISFFETKEEAEEGNRKALEWAKEQLFPLALGPAEIIGVGKVVLHQRKEG
ncbi:hypothetical protein [Ktedonospora formicarum]|uniref:ABM domain-containing protein n=1 Tax=Ktedonospora formicarum TaxID=2778364 RepID=A0A8J3I5K5_9CHLR|nr:hypothetical protein [Ktedonospora formicarum]GHO47483.1 hypothetical protein KSX_56460 [Ktedonospora formicarum]